MEDTALRRERRTGSPQRGTRRGDGREAAGAAVPTTQAAAARHRDVRKRLLAAALELFNRKGYAATTVREIVAAAGVTKPVLYYHFGSKEGIYQAILREPLARFEAELAACEGVEGSVRERIAGLLVKVYDLFCEHLPIVRLVHAVFYGPAEGAPPFDFEAFHRVYLAALRRLVAEGVARGEFRPVPPDDVALALQGVAAVCMDMELVDLPVRPGREGLRRLLDLLFEGVGAAARGQGE